MLRQIHTKISLTRCISSLQEDFTDILHYPVGEVGSVCTSLHEPTAQICLWCSGSLKHTIFHFSLFFFSKSLASASRSRHSRHFTSLWASLWLFVLLCLPPCHLPLFIQTSLRSSLSRCGDNYARVHFRLFGTKKVSEIDESETQESQGQMQRRRGGYKPRSTAPSSGKEPYCIVKSYFCAWMLHLVYIYSSVFVIYLYRGC